MAVQSMLEIVLKVVEIVNGVRCVLNVSEVLGVPGVPEEMRCVLLCMLEAVEGGFCLLEVSKMIRCVPLSNAGGAGGDALYVGGRGE